MKEKYTLSVYTENQMELINKIAIMFLRKKISLESLNISSCEIDKMYRFTIVINETFEIVNNLVHQIEKIIDVFKCYCNTEDEIIYTQTALFKISTNVVMNDQGFNFLLSQYNAKYLCIEKEYTIIEVMALQNKIDELITLLLQYELIEFIKSSKIALIKSNEGFANELLKMDNN